MWDIGGRKGTVYELHGHRNKVSALVYSRQHARYSRQQERYSRQQDRYSRQHARYSKKQNVRFVK